MIEELKQAIGALQAIVDNLETRALAGSKDVGVLSETFTVEGLPWRQWADNTDDARADSEILVNALKGEPEALWAEMVVYWMHRFEEVGDAFAEVEHQLTRWQRKREREMRGDDG